MNDAPIAPRESWAPSGWDRETDIVVIGAGATGLPAAIVAREAGASVIVVEAPVMVPEQVRVVKAVRKVVLVPVTVAV